MRAEFPSLRSLTSARRRATRLAAPVSAQAANGESLEDRTLLSQTPLTLVVSETSAAEDSFVEFEVSAASDQIDASVLSEFLARLESTDLAEIVASDEASATVRLGKETLLSMAEFQAGDVYVLATDASLSFDGSNSRVVSFGNDILLPDEDRADDVASDSDGSLPGLPSASLSASAFPFADSVSMAEEALAAGPAGFSRLPPAGELPVAWSSASQASVSQSSVSPAESSLTQLPPEPPETSVALPLAADDFARFGHSNLATSTDLAAADTDVATKAILARPADIASVNAANAPEAGEAHSISATNYEAAFVPATMSQLASPVTTVLAGLAAAADTVVRVVLVALGADGGDGPAASIIDPAAPALDAAAVARGDAPKWALGKSVDELLEFSRVTIVGGEGEADVLESAPVTMPPAGQNGVLAVQVETLPQHGELQETVGRLGQYRYTADPGFSGVDTFSYLVVTPGGGSSRGLVTVVVPEAPAAQRVGLQADINLNHPQAHDFVVELAQSVPMPPTGETAIDESFRLVDLWADEL